jgi:hypothetical protein
MYYTWFAERHHWTPEQVDNLPWLMQDRLMAVATTRDQIAKDKRPKE